VRKKYSFILQWPRKNSDSFTKLPEIIVCLKNIASGNSGIVHVFITRFRSRWVATLYADIVA